MTILHISDTHGLHRQLAGLPEADVIVHSGDFTQAGTEHEALDFMNWFCDLPYRHKIFIAGNHDDCLYGAELSGLDDNCHYLCRSGVCIDGVNFYGIPLFVGDVLYGTDKPQDRSVPRDTEVLITHRPPLDVLDFDGGRRYGCPELLKEIEAARPKLHLFGHIHAAFGIEKRNGILFSNAALVDGYCRLKEERVASLKVIEVR